MRRRDPRKRYDFTRLLQGCWRMRGLGMVSESISWSCKRSNSSSQRQCILHTSGDISAAKIVVPKRQPLVDVVAWLVTNSMRSEMIQFMQLQQMVTNLWRKSAFRALMASKIPKQQNRRTESMLTTRFHAPVLQMTKSRLHWRISPIT